MITIKSLIQDAISKAFVKVKAVTDDLSGSITNINESITNVANQAYGRNQYTNCLSGSTRTSFTPTNGSNSGCYYYKVGTRVTVHIGVSGLTNKYQQAIYTMPSGYRPGEKLEFVGRAMINVDNGTLTPGEVEIYSNGTIYVHSSSQAIFIDFSYDAFTS